MTLTSEQMFLFVAQQNEGRNQRLVERKEGLMAKDPLSFLRGSALLFWKQTSMLDLPLAPPIWGSGDLHVHNFGTFKGSNRLTYFDINDFDEACLLPAFWEPLRMMVSLRLCGANALSFADRWIATIAAGKAAWIERETAEGAVRDLMDRLKKRSREEFLDSRTTKNRGARTFTHDGDRTYPASIEEKQHVEEAINTCLLSRENPDFFKVLDIAHRAAGNGSLGLERYVVLVEGKGSPDNNHILDLKLSVPSHAGLYSPIKQPEWPAENQRIVTLQERLQAVPPAFLEAVQIDGRPFVLKALQPSENKIEWEKVIGKQQQSALLIQNVADVSAWALLRASGRQEAASVEELVGWATQTGLARQLDDFAALIEQQVRADWEAFARNHAEQN